MQRREKVLEINWKRKKEDKNVKITVLLVSSYKYA